MIAIVARVASCWPNMSLAGDADSFHDRQEHDHDGCRCDAHVSDIENRPVRELQEVDHMTAQHSGRSKQPIGEVARNAGTQESDGHGPSRMTDPWHQLDDHKGKHQDRCDGKDVCETLTLTERSAGVSNEPERQQSAE
jgi:hypothetical protein